MVLLDSQSFQELTHKQEGNVHSLTLKGYWFKASPTFTVNLGHGDMVATLVERKYNVNDKSTYVVFTA